MSVLYPLTFLKDSKRSKNGKRNTTLRILLVCLIAGLSFQSSFAQEDKEAQMRREAELKKQEAIHLAEKLKANPNMKQKMAVVNQQDVANPDQQLADEKKDIKPSYSKSKKKVRPYLW